MALVHEIVYYIECDACQKRGPEIRDAFCDIATVTQAAGFTYTSCAFGGWLCPDCHESWALRLGHETHRGDCPRLQPKP